MAKIIRGDDLDTARGIILGAIAGLILWIAAAYLVALVIR
jgi:hypothetical protein